MYIRCFHVISYVLHTLLRRHCIDFYQKNSLLNNFQILISSKEYLSLDIKVEQGKNIERQFYRSCKLKNLNSDEHFKQERFDMKNTIVDKL